ncbi:hypothetical protein WOLCODRAFT_27331 [Wolfiporia cocos MD-104 SS10]|uniref:F-box domain-containing protein n=1 Tax=Wolfiporia cocos (strain MD-104) TaxID=742152 RepID=A0A2H3IY11_WOLCO|nr:hypothetical protein WOLCODRAFT_27331 [Wolfiporia cocos MD-104 SS10]
MSVFKHRRRTVFLTDEADSLQTLEGRESVKNDAPSRLSRRITALSVIGAKLAHGKTKRARTAHGSTLAPPVGHTVDFPRTYSRESTPSPTPSLDEIRMPFGLGRMASESSLRSAALEQAGREPNFAVGPRERCMSTPTLLTNASARLKGVLAASSPEGAAGPAVARVPPELWAIVFGFCSRAEIVSWARISKTLHDAATHALYERLDLRELTPECVERCINTLASRRSSAALVRAFTCSVLPASDGGTPSLSTVSCAIALNHMENLRSLTLPRFDAQLLYHASFRLTRLTLLADSMSSDELGALLSWLEKQPDIATLSFPTLRLFSAAPSIPSHVLPRLAHFHGPAPMASVAIPGRPVKSAVLHVHNTLYDGLKPSALMTALTRSASVLTHLVVEASATAVDARTLERVLMSAGAALGSQLEVLGVLWALPDEILYKQLLAVLPRFRTLHTLRLRRAPGAPTVSAAFLSVPPSSPSASSLYLSAPPSPAPTIASLAVPQPAYGSRPSTPASMADLPEPRAQERALLNAWNRHCPTLRTVVFLGGAEWRCGGRFASCIVPGQNVYAQSWRFVGLSGTQACMHCE